MPEAGQKTESQAELHSFIASRGELVKHRVALLNKVNAMFVRHGVKIQRKKLTGVTGFERAVASRERSRVEQVEIAAVTGSGTLSAALFQCTIGDVERFSKPGNLAS